jgi:hypothetical protein
LEGLGTFTQTIEIRTEGEGRLLDVRQLRTGKSPGEWRSLEVSNARLTRNVLSVHGVENLNALEMSTQKEELSAEIVLKQRVRDELKHRSIDRITASPGRGVRVAPKNWHTLDKSEIVREVFSR